MKKNLVLYIIAILLGTAIVLLLTWLFGFESAVIYTLGFILGKLLLIDLKS
jgi:hypothetical protein